MLYRIHVCLFVAILLSACGSDDPTFGPLSRDLGPDTFETDTALDSDSDSDITSDAADADATTDTELDTELGVDIVPDLDPSDADVPEPDTDTAPGDVSPDLDASDVPEDADASDSETGDADIEDLGPTSLEEFLALLRTEGEDAAFALAASHGWPIPVEGGLLLVSFDEALPQVAGDFDEWVGTALTPDEGFAWLVISAAADSGYKLTDGDRFVADPFARSYAFDEFGELSLIRPTGAHLDRWLQVTDGVVESRTVHIWVPTTTTDTVYAHDGQNLFNPDAIWGGWRLQESAPEGLMIVGIEHGTDRVGEFTWIEDDLRGETLGGGAAEYADFVQLHVRNLVREHYGEPGAVGLLGSSLGGLVSLYIADRFPDEYEMAISMSGTLGWGSLGAHRETMLDRYRAAGVRSTRLYLDSGGEVAGECFDSDGDGINDDNESASDNYCTNRQFADEMAALGYVWDESLWHWWEPGAPHNEAAWAARVGRPLELFVGE